MKASTVVTKSPHIVSAVSAIERPNITDARGIGTERRVSGTAGRGAQEPTHEELDVVEPSTRVDGAAEDVAEHEQEQRTLNCSQHEQLGRAEELEDGSFRALERGGHEAGAGGAVDSRAGGDVSAACSRGRHDNSK